METQPSTSKSANIRSWVTILTLIATCITAAILARYQMTPAIVGNDLYIITLDRFTGRTFVRENFP